MPAARLRPKVLDATKSDRGFIYIGHGDQQGPFAAEGFNFGIRKRLVEPSQVRSWLEAPQIWWCCYSATWLRSQGSDSWIGFADVTGHDARGGQQLRAVMQVMLNAAEGRTTGEAIREKAKDVYDGALRGYLREERLSYATVILARFLSTGVDFGAQFEVKR
jgi:hypothetical protein